jgi:hypothetical protein
MYNHTYRGWFFLDFDCATLIMTFFSKIAFKTNKSKGKELGSNASNKIFHTNMQIMFYILVLKWWSFSKNQKNLQQNIPIWFFPLQDEKVAH